MNYKTDNLGLTLRQFERKVNTGIYTKTLIIKILIHDDLNAELIRKVLDQYFCCSVAKRTLYKYLRELIKCGIICKYISLSDTRISIYALKEVIKNER